MSKCKIVFNTQGEKVGIQEIGSDRPSQTFQNILNDVHTKNFDEAVQIYKNLYAEDIEFVTEKIPNENSVQTAIQKNNGNPLNLAPNGKPSILYQSYKDLGYSDSEAERLVSQVYSDSFLDFFGDWINDPQNASKVVDENGEPLVVYHGSNKFYYAFDNNNKWAQFENKRFNEFSGDRRRFSHTKRGFYFGDKNTAINYANEDGVKGEIYSVFINAKTPLINNDGVTFNIEGSLIDSRRISDEDYNILVKKDVDSLISYLNSIELNEIVVFNSNQIKSATENVGTFSTDINDIMFSLSQADPTLKYQTEEGNIYTSYSEALRNTNGNEIKIGVNNLTGFIEIYSKSTNSNIETQDGLINHLIKAEILSDKSYKENGKTHLIPEGRNFAKKRINAENIKDAFQKQLGIKSAKLKADSSIELSEDKQRNKVTVTAKNGEQITVDISELNAPFSELKNKFDTFTVATALATDAVQKEMSKKTEVSPVKLVPESELQKKLISLLNKFGISMLSIDSYLKNHNIKTNIPASARALADLANKVVAFKDGIVENDDLVEETAHLIVASIPETEKANLKRNIHKTKEWGEYANQYEGVYATEDELREEILGKVVANAIKEKFAARESNQTENAIIAKIKELFDKFIQNIKNFFQDSYRTELDKLNNDIFNNLFAETLELDLDGKKGLFFNANEASLDSKRLVKVTGEALDYVRLQQNQLNKKYKDSSDTTYIEQSKRLIAMEENAFILDGVSKFARLVSSQTNRLITSANKKQEGEFPLTAEENLIYQNLKNNVRGTISEIDQLLNNKDNSTQKRIKEDLVKTKNNLDILEAKVRANTRPAIEKMTQDIMSRFDMTDTEKKEYQSIIEASISGTIQDTDIMHTHIGSLLNARNGLLNMAGLISRRLIHQTNEDFQINWKGLVNKLSPLNWTNGDFRKVIDSETNTIIHEIDPKEVKKWEDIEKAKIIKDVFNSQNIQGFETLEAFLESTELQVDKNYVEDEFYKMWNKVSSSRLEPYYKKEFSDRREAHKFYINGTEVIVSSEALTRDKEYSRQIGEIRKSSDSGILTTEDKEKIKEISLRRAEEANPRDISTGEYLKGVTEAYDASKKRYFVVRSGESNLSTQEEIRARVVVGLNQISYKTQDFLKGDGSKGIPQNFLDNLSELNTIEEKLDFLKNNAYISYSDAYYEEISEKDNIVDKLRGLETDEADKLIEDIRKQKSVIENIKKANAIKNEPGEIDVVGVTDVQRNSIILAQSILENYYKDSRNLLKDVEMESFDAITRPTDSYLAHVDGMTLEEELNFIKKNTTPFGEGKLLDARRIAKKERSISTSFRKIFSDDMNIDERNEVLVQYARTLLLPHLKKTEPKDYSEQFAKVKSGKLSVEDWIQGGSVKVSPSFGFYEDNESNINPKWTENKKAGKEQYTEEYLAKVKDKRFDEIKKDKRLYEGWKAIMQYQDYQIENNNLTGVQSRYLAPNVRRTTTQRVLSLTPQGVKETFKEMVQFRPEEQELGAQLNNGLYTIPTYYNKPLEDAKEQTTDYLWAFAVYGQAATLHKYRRENISDMMVLDDALSNTKENGKNTYKMFKSFMEYNFYGKQENFSYKIGGVDVGKLLKTVNNFAKKYNIATLSVPITSFAQASVAKNMERVIGETIDSASSNVGNRLWANLASASAREAMGFDSKSTLNVLGESFGLYSMVHRYENSQLSKAGRLFTNLSSKLHEMGNFPVIQRSMLGVIASYRYVDGKIMHYNKFRQKLELENFKGNIQTEWKKQPEFINDFLLAVDNGVLDLSSPKFLNAVTPKLTNIPKEKTVEEYLQDRKLDIGVRMQAFIQRIDSQVPSDERAIIQRDSRLNFFMSHLGWLISAIPRRVKQRHYNVSEESFQEGSWRTAVEFVAKIVKNPKEAAKIYGELDFGQKKNLRRTMMELGYANALALLGLILSQMSDDDDDPLFALTMADYFTNRVAVETISGTVGLPSSLMGVLDNPIMLVTKMKTWGKITDLAGTDEERWKYLKSYSGYLRDYEKFSDFKQARQDYLYFQNEKKNLYDIYAPLTLLYAKNEE